MWILILALMGLQMVNGQPVGSGTPSQKNNPPGKTEKTVVAPKPGGQTHFLSRWEFEVLFGGETGPGKTWALVIDALGLQFKSTDLGKAAIDVPSYRAVIFRRKTKELGKLIDEGQKYYPQFGAIYAAQRKGEPGASFTFPSGAKIFLCHMENEQNKRDHDGFEYQFVGYDELTHFSITQYLYLMSRMRGSVPGLFTRIRATAMPVGLHLGWVKKRFITNLEPLTTYAFIAGDNPIENPKGIQTSLTDKNGRTRIFVPGYLKDNDSINQDEYRGNVKQLGKRYEKAMLEHDWEAFGGDFFKEFDMGKEIIDPFEIPAHWNLIGSLDPGFSSPMSFGLMAQSPEGIYYRIATYYFAMKNPNEHAKDIRKFIDGCLWTGGRMPNMIVSGVDAWAKRDKFAIQATEKVIADIFREEGLILHRAVNDRIPGWWAVRSLMPDRLFIFKGTNQDLIDELIAAVADEHNVEDIQGCGNDPHVSDHALDDLRYGVMSSFKPSKPKSSNISWQERLMQTSTNSGWLPGMG